MMKSLNIAAGISLLLLSPMASADSIQSTLSVYEAKDCEPVVNDALTRKKIDRSRLTKTEYITIELNPGEDLGEDYTYEAWLSFAGCRGNMVISMDRACFIQQTYKTGTCDKIDLTKNQSLQ